MNWRTAWLVWLLAAPGPIAIAWLALPSLVDPSTLAVSIETLQFATAAQGLILVAITSALGTLLSTKVGLRAPAISALASGGDTLVALRPQILPGVVGGVAGAAVIMGFYAYAPATLSSIQGQSSIPLAARLLYGGITEEILIRWGLMTLLVWAGWRVFQRAAGVPSAWVVWPAIGLSALIFGISHVPSVAVSMGAMPAAIIAYITVGNALFGVVAGYLFWRSGLEAAIMAHALAHVLAYFVRG